MSATTAGESWEDALRATRGMLELTEAYPDLLPPALDAVAGNLAVETYRRVRLERHPCLRCGQVATTAYLVTRREPSGWRRWLDVCPRCAVLLEHVAAETGRKHGEWA